MYVPSGYWKNAYSILDDYHEKLISQELGEISYLAKAWGKIQKNLQLDLEDLAKLAVEKKLTRSGLYRLDKYQEFINVTKTQISKYNDTALDAISNAQRQAGKWGIEATEYSLDYLKVKFNRLPVSVVENFIGISKQGERLYTLLEKSYPETVLKITDAMLMGIVKGDNPLTVARAMTKVSNIPLTRAMRIARTEQLNIFRKTSLEAMKRSGVVSAWQWYAVSTDACDYCLEHNGKEYDLETIMETHPNCRCTEIAVV